MASPTFKDTYIDFHNDLHIDPTRPQGAIPKPPTNLKDGVTHEWSEFLRRNLIALFDETEINRNAYHAPRRKARNPYEAELATDIAQLLYPSSSESTLPALIKYQNDVTLLRRTILAQQKAEEERSKRQTFKSTLRERIALQGPWDEVKDPLPLTGVSSLPMPVKVSSGWTLAPFFEHLKHGDDYQVPSGQGEMMEEPFYGVEMGEWEKGMLYQDGRMDLCKKVVGPDHIGDLMSSLESNTFVRHFLLGNNIIGLVGAREIASYLDRHLNQMQTWYLAGNCIDWAGLELLVKRWTKSSTVTNIWLKRNPLGSKSIRSLSKLIIRTPHLRTLDLDQTELSDAGVAELFDMLVQPKVMNLPLRHLYLNATGISVSACHSIAKYLALPECRLESLYISNNPIGDRGALALAQGLASNPHLQRLSIRSCGLKNAGAIAIMNALTQHQKITTLDLSHNYSTEDLKSRYNYFDDEIETATLGLLQTSQSLRLLDFGITGMTIPCISKIIDAVAESQLLVFKAESIHSRLPLKVRQDLRASLTENVKAKYGRDMTYAEFEEGEQRWLVSPADVRFIDSGYRNRDAGLARRGLLVLDKRWEDEGELNRIVYDKANDGVVGAEEDW
ncbi:MAG: hypothetical protein Q9209_004501 [Squamulea sp. 1 TL-2023]